MQPLFYVGVKLTGEARRSAQRTHQASELTATSSWGRAGGAVADVCVQQQGTPKESCPASGPIDPFPRPGLPTFSHKPPSRPTPPGLSAVHPQGTPAHSAFAPATAWLKKAPGVFSFPVPVEKPCRAGLNSRRMSGNRRKGETCLASTPKQPSNSYDEYHWVLGTMHGPHPKVLTLTLLFTQHENKMYSNLWLNHTAHGQHIIGAQ